MVTALTNMAGFCSGLYDLCVSFVPDLSWHVGSLMSNVAQPMMNLFNLSRVRAARRSKAVRATRSALK